MAIAFPPASAAIRDAAAGSQRRIVQESGFYFWLAKERLKELLPASNISAGAFRACLRPTLHETHILPFARLSGPQPHRLGDGADHCSRGGFLAPAAAAHRAAGNDSAAPAFHLAATAGLGHAGNNLHQGRRAHQGPARDDVHRAGVLQSEPAPA